MRDTHSYSIYHIILWIGPCAQMIKSSLDKHSQIFESPSSQRTVVVLITTHPFQLKTQKALQIKKKVICRHSCFRNLLTAHLTRQSLRFAVCSDKSIKPTGMLSIFERQDRYESVVEFDQAESQPSVHYRAFQQ